MQSRRDGSPIAARICLDVTWLPSLVTVLVNRLVRDATPLQERRLQAATTVPTEARPGDIVSARKYPRMTRPKDLATSDFQDDRSNTCR